MTMKQRVKRLKDDVEGTLIAGQGQSKDGVTWVMVHFDNASAPYRYPETGLEFLGVRFERRAGDPPVSANEMADALRREIQSQERLVAAIRADEEAKQRVRIAPGWSCAGRIGKRIGPTFDHEGTKFVPVLWEDEIGSGGRPEYVLESTLEEVPNGPVLVGMIYMRRRIGDPRHPLLMQGGEALNPSQYEEVVRRSNKWGQLTRLYATICEQKWSTSPSVKEELGRILGAEK